MFSIVVLVIFIFYSVLYFLPLFAIFGNKEFIYYCNLFYTVNIYIYDLEGTRPKIIKFQLIIIYIISIKACLGEFQSIFQISTAALSTTEIRTFRLCI